MVVPQTIQQQLTVAREHALSGEYDSAAVYYKSVLAQIAGYEEESCPPTWHHRARRYTPVSDAARAKWNGLRKLVQDELTIVAKLSKEKATLVKTAGPLLATGKVLCASVKRQCTHPRTPVQAAEHENRPYNPGNASRPMSPHVQVFTVRAQPARVFQVVRHAQHRLTILPNCVPAGTTRWPHQGPTMQMCGGHPAAAPGSHCALPLWPAHGTGAVRGCSGDTLINIAPKTVRRSGTKPVSAKVDSWRATPRSSAPARRGSGGVEGVPATGRPRYEGPDQELAAALERDLVDASPGVHWDDIAGALSGQNMQIRWCAWVP